MTTESGVRSTTHLRVQRRTANTARVTLGIANHENGHHSGAFDRPPTKSLSGVRMGANSPSTLPLFPSHGPFFAGWSVLGVAGAVRRHPLPCAFAILLLVFMAVEYTIPMVPSASQPLDLGFLLTKPLNAALAAAPALNTALAALNTVSMRLMWFSPLFVSLLAPYK